MNVNCSECKEKLILTETLLCSNCGTDKIDFSILYITLYSLMMEDGIDAGNAEPDDFMEYLKKKRGE